MYGEQQSGSGQPERSRRMGWFQRLLGRRAYRGLEHEASKKLELARYFLPATKGSMDYEAIVIPHQRGSIAFAQIAPSQIGEMTLFQFSRPDEARDHFWLIDRVFAPTLREGTDMVFTKLVLDHDSGELTVHPSVIEELVPNDAAAQAVSLSGRLTGEGSDTLDRIVLIKPAPEHDRHDRAELVVNGDLAALVARLSSEAAKRRPSAL